MKVRKQNGRYKSNKPSKIIGALVLVAFIVGLGALLVSALMYDEPQEFISPLSKVAEVVEPYTPEWLDSLSDLERKVCLLWGEYDCKIAIAHCRAESGCDNTRFNLSENSVGAFQINWVHWHPSSASYKEYCALELIATEDGNINCAHKLQQEQGWGIWSVNWNGAATAEYNGI